MRVCLFGGAGFVGSHLADWLLERPDVEVVAADLHHEKILHLLDEPRFRFYASDIRHDRELTQRLIETCDVVVDLIGVSPPEDADDDPLQVFRLDFLENMRVAELCAATDTRLVQFSSSEVYGRSWMSVVPEQLLELAPDEALEQLDVALREDETPMIVEPVHQSRWLHAASRHLLERAIHAAGAGHGLDYSIIRPFNFVGPRFSGIAEHADEPARTFGAIMDSLLLGRPFELPGGGQPRRSFVYIEDAIECVGRIVLDRSGATSRQIFNIGNPANEASFEELARLMRTTYAAHHWDGIAPLPEVEPAASEGPADRHVPDIGKAQRLLGWEPRWGLDDLVTATMDALVADHRQAHERAELAAAPVTVRVP